MRNSMKMLAMLVVGGWMTQSVSAQERLASGGSGSISITIDRNAEDLETEIRKAQLLVQLREMELRAAQERLSQEAQQMRLGTYQSDVVEATAKLNEQEQAYKELKAAAENGFASKQELARRESMVEQRKAQLEAVKSAMASAEIELAQSKKEADLAKDRGHIAVELARTELDALRKKLERQAAEKALLKNIESQKRVSEESKGNASGGAVGGFRLATGKPPMIVQRFEEKQGVLQQSLDELTVSLAEVKQAGAKFAKVEVSEQPTASEVERLRAFVEQQFELEQRERQLRVELARVKLDLVEMRRERRAKQSEAIIKRMLNQLLEKK